jgi:phosphatidylinositol alpha-mannosyltransferase
VVLAPVDRTGVVSGVAPDGFVGLGRSIPLPANGSVAPVALGPGAAWRAVRAVRAGGFDVLHLHEPLAPGPGYACLLWCALPKVGTFHRAGASVAYRLFGPLARTMAGRLAARCAVSSQARATAQDALGGAYDIIGNGIDLERFAVAPRFRTQGPTVLFVGRHEERKGLGVLLEAVDRLDPGGALTVWVVGEGPDTERLRHRHPPGTRVQWLGRIDDSELASRLAGAHV